eukprot:563634_1
MACACPCFGDEADAEEKPNQMIQLDGLGMLRLDTQHVGQGSQGMRSAKWFYFGETDNRLAVVNLLLCITCAMMWLCIFLAAQNGAFTWTAPKKLIVAEQHSEAIVEDSTNDAKDYVDLKKKYDDQVATGKVKKSKTVALTKHTRIIEEFNEYKVNHPEEVTKDMNQELITQKTGLEDQLKTAKQEITTRTAVLENLKADIDEIQSEFGSEKIELKKLPAYLRSIHESKVYADNELQDMKEKFAKLKPFYDVYVSMQDQMKANESKGGEDSNKETNYDNNNDNDNNTNDVDNPNISIKEHGTNDANQ